MYELIEQGTILVCGVTSVFLTQSPHPALRKWACIIGLLAQPFWLYMTWRAQQWGVLITTVFYTACFTYGFFNFWVFDKAP